MYDDTIVLRHHGIKGMKWGVRRYQNSDGSLTPAGREHYGVGPPRPPSNASSKPVRRIGGLNEQGTNEDDEKAARDAERAAQKEAKQAQRQAAKELREEKREIAKDREQALRDLTTLEDDDLDKRIKRLEKENKLRKLSGVEEHGKSAVETFMSGLGGKAVTAAVMGSIIFAGQQLIVKAGAPAGSNINNAPLLAQYLHTILSRF